MAISKILISNLNDIYVNFFSSVSNDLFNPKKVSKFQIIFRILDCFFFWFLFKLTYETTHDKRHLVVNHKLNNSENLQENGKQRQHNIKAVKP